MYERTGIMPSTISRWERGVEGPDSEGPNARQFTLNILTLGLELDEAESQELRRLMDLPFVPQEIDDARLVEMLPAILPPGTDLDGIIETIRSS
jgi:transcriptional regulator with XRE-family HTH domain